MPAQDAGAEDKIRKLKEELEHETAKRMRTEKELLVSEDRYKRLLESVEEQLSRSRKMQSADRLAGGIAHDFNNYLTVIIGFSETLTRKFKPEDMQYQILRKISDAAIKASEMARQILTLSNKPEGRDGG